MLSAMCANTCEGSASAHSPLLRSPVLVYQGIKGQAILPAGGEVGDIDVGVAVSKRKLSHEV